MVLSEKTRIRNDEVEDFHVSHLEEINVSDKYLRDDQASSHSHCKQKIDAMFDDRKSSRSKVIGNEGAREKERTATRAKYRVRMRIIEDSEPAKHEGEKNVHRKNRQKRERIMTDSKLQVDSKSQDWFRKEFRVIYLGSKCLRGENVNLASLQDPLKEIYTRRMKNISKNNVFVLSITKEGLKIKSAEKEELNSFSNIAVWASVKLNFRDVGTDTEYAFTPLVFESEATHENTPFDELRFPDTHVVSNHGEKFRDNPPSIFTIVLRSSEKNHFECHGFMCESSKEAILIAANLYQELLKNLKRKDVNWLKSENEKINKSSKPEAEAEEGKMHPFYLKADPRRAKGTDVFLKISNDSTGWKRSESQNKNHGFAKGGINCVRAEEVDQEARRIRTTVEGRQETKGNLVGKDGNSEGDILTKVTIPRGRSCLKAIGPLFTFSGARKTNRKIEITSPLGLRELFNEFHINEGLENVDDILNVIIDAEGMSFNDLKPIYKEFLLKLALTLTEDELYQRSKSIMRRQKKKRKHYFRNNSFLQNVTLRKITKKKSKKVEKSKNKRRGNFEFTKLLFRSCESQVPLTLPNIKKSEKRSYKCKRKQMSHRKLAKKMVSTSKKRRRVMFKRNRVSGTTINLSDGGGPNRSSSGYFSCSECSCNSETSTCTNGDKCYCGRISLRNSDFHPGLRPSPSEKSNETLEKHAEDSVRTCSRDSESCTYSEKCYCAYGKIKGISGVKRFKDKGLRSRCENNKYFGNSIYGDTKYKKTTLMKFKMPETSLKPFSKSEYCMRKLNFFRIKKLTNRIFKENLRPSKVIAAHKNCRMQKIQNIFFQSTGFENLQGDGCLPTCINKDIRANNGFPDKHSCSAEKIRYSTIRCSPIQQNLLSSMGPFLDSFNRTRTRHAVMSQIKFTSMAFTDNDSLRFTNRMDVYNTFS